MVVQIKLDPIVWVAANNTNSEKHPKSVYPPFLVNIPASDVQTQVEQVADILVSRGIDITDDYNDWLRLGFALADGLGEQGREMYHRISSMSRKYKTTDCDRQYDRCLKSHGSGVTANTFFWMAKQAGVDVAEIAKCATAPSGANTRKVEKSTILGIFS